MVNAITSEDPIAPVVKEVERTICFTDVPCGAMKFRHCDETNKSKSPESNNAEEDNVIKEQFMNFCGTLERAFCFSDLDDISQTDLERLRSMKSLEIDGTSPQKEAAEEAAPALEAADTDSMSDDSAENNKDHKEAKDEAPTAWEKPVDALPVLVQKTGTSAAEPIEAPVKKAARTTVKATKEMPADLLPAKNEFQASHKKSRSGKPLNSLQASKLQKKKEKAQKKKEKAAAKKKKGWSLFRRSAKAAV